GVTAAITGLVSPVWAMIAMISSVTPVLANSFGGQLLAGRTPNIGYQSLTDDGHHQGPDPMADDDEKTYTSDQPAFFDTVIDGHTVRFWAATAGLITMTTLLLGLWWI
ncbi:MAG: hypothetical protein O6834_03025, partial [Actinobacteria bacterium]|nr:hypothetical protein [Actinomycetota bacterium]